ncbi:MAG TPA: hypothetical protein VFV89_00435 [Nocardioides sp.]|uniref:hypothetical protein n=1 Tax=Nocardioides sp. TaxID=35761 RepID=UPI002E3678EF|nr:hypothetical protein [Nocardioides sp.]HEX5086244.1 hypothetical protein [Nocardioides sp.]
MRNKLVRGSAVAAGLGLAATALAVSPAQAATVTQVRAADLVTSLNDVRSAGHYDFLAEGVHVKTDNASSQAKVALYFPVTGALPTTGNVEWYGTSPAPGAQLVFDADNITGNGNDYNVLVGESVYGDNWWLTSSSSATAKAADPSGAENGGNGSEWFGTLAQWKAALPAATVKAGGFSLGSGIQGEGVVRAVNLGDTSYVFTSAAKTKVSVTANAKRPTVKTGNNVVIKGTATPAGAGAKVTLELKKNGTWKVVQAKDLAASGSFKLKDTAGKVGKAKYRVTVSETNSTAAATSNKVKVLVVKK